MRIKSEESSSTSVKEGKYSIMILPKEDASMKSLDIFSLEGPNNRKFLLMRNEEGNLRELRAYYDAHRCWFVGEIVESDGRLWMSTEFDPVFLVLPYLKTQKKVPLDHLIPDERITDSPLLKTRLSLVADPIGDKDLNVWKLNSAKCLEYFAKKVEAIAQVIARDSIHIDSTSAEGFTRHSSEDDLEGKRTIYALGILSDYIDKDLFSELMSHLGISPTVAESVPNKKRSSSASENEKDSKRRKSAPEEDYLNSQTEERQTKTLTQRQKVLAKSASGSKNIASFFSKK